MFCRVYGFRVKVSESYRTSRSFGYEHGSVAELTEVPGIVARACRTHRSSGRVQKMLYLYPGYCGTGVYITHRSSGYEYEMSYRTHRSSRYGYESLTELPEVPGIVARAYRTYLQKFRAGIKMLYSYPGYCGTGVYRS